MSKSYPDQHLEYISMRCNAKVDNYGRMTKSETKYAYFQQLVNELINDKFSRKQRFLDKKLQEEFTFFITKDPLSDALMEKVKRVVDILFCLKIEDIYIVEKSYLILSDLAFMAKVEGSEELVVYCDQNPEVYDLLEKTSLNSYLSKNGGHYRHIGKENKMYQLETILLRNPTTIACMPELDEWVQKEYANVLDYCRKYRNEVYVELENSRELQGI